MTAQTPTSHSRIFAEIRAELARELSLGFRTLLPVLASELEAAGERSAASRDRQALYDACAALRLDPGKRARRIETAFDNVIITVLEATKIRDPGARALALMGDDALDTQVLAAPLAQAVRDGDPQAYLEFAASVRAISPADWSDDEFNPLGARSLAHAMVSALDDVLDSPAVRASLRAVLPRRAAPLMARLTAQALRAMQGAGVRAASLPTLPTAEGPQALPPAAPGAADDVPGESGRHEQAKPAPAEVPNAAGAAPASQAALERLDGVDEHARRLGTSALADVRTETRLRVLPTLQPVIDIERDAVAFAHSIGEIPYSRAARGHYFGNVRARLGQASASSAQLAMVDVVAALFDYVVDDRRLPPAAHPLVWRLQQPALALTLLDPGYLGEEPRSLRRLIENFGAIANAFAEDLTRGSELYRRMETVVRAVEIVTSALQVRSAVMSRQVEREYSRAAGNIGQLIERIVRERVSLESTPGRRNRRDYARRPNRDQEREVTARIEQMLDERLARHSVPESVRVFLHKVWLRHLRTAVFRDGEESGEFRVALQVVDDLLWTLDEGGSKKVSRRDLVARIPPLIQVLTQGLREIGAKEEEHQSFFDELFLIHLRKLQRQDRSSTIVFPPDLVVPAVAKTEVETGSTRPSRATMYDVQGSFPTLHDELQVSRPPAEDGGASPTTPDVPADEGIGAAAPLTSVRSGDDPAPDQARAADPSHRLLEILDSVDLADLPEPPRRLITAPAQAFAGIARGDWLEIEGTDGSQRFMKIAWINRRRTVALLVRHPDRRAVSLQMSELARRFVAGRAFALERN